MSELKIELSELMTCNDDLKDEFSRLSKESKITISPSDLMKEHIKRLKQYNELRDTGLRLAQLIANEKDSKISEIFEEMGFDMKD
ncbi:LAQU0S10e02432g1_1 [Lachancea quebecensis]|uniref:LAQU0S10e02432g1_1 n=1 Tax=Lachancea quebecensis TaxID=1654605 RepID=A0A0P1KUD5_9SACH|nr:LAQU0S10e02432g1_1 [Lachancea quebecensis]